MLRTVSLSLLVCIPLNLAAQTGSSELAGTLSGRAETGSSELAGTDVATSSNLQMSSLDKSVERKKKKTKEDEQEQEALVEDQARQFETLEKSEGVVLRGVIKVQGFHFAIYMNRNLVQKIYHDNWVKRKMDKTTRKSSRKYYLAEFDMWFKLLHFPYDTAEMPNELKKRTAKKYADSGMKGDLQEVLTSGFIGKVRLKGWWNDAAGHFRLDEMEEKDISDLSWMHRIMLPWKDLDCRFDTEGCTCRADFIEESKGWFGRTFSSEPVHYLTFRLDALNSKLNPKRVMVGMASLQEIDYAVKMDYENCLFSQEWRRDSKDSSFQCPLMMRPLVVSNIQGCESPEKEVEAREQKYISDAGTGGSWFTYIGMMGSNILKFERAGNAYKAKSLSTECLGDNPCPFITHQDYDVQFTAQVAIFDPKVGPEEISMLFPIWDEFLMEQSPSSANVQKILPEVKGINPTQDLSGRKANRPDQMKADQDTIKAKESTITSLYEKITACKNDAKSSSLVQTMSGKEFRDAYGKLQSELDAVKKELQRLKQM